MPAWLTAMIQAISQWTIWQLGQAKQKQDNINTGKTEALDGLKTGNDQEVVDGITQIGENKK